ncbi:hypothetical protein [Winogradskyella sp. MH6]|uniref:hypothetical protein n=1 Tax=Winogradskyella sp. MH6 TaxID=2929510 RepID=UPI001FB4D229|nr:hypothetical protein [Winogradskyella sp. MH6]
MKKKKKYLIFGFIIINLILIPWIVFHNECDFEKIIKYTKELAIFEFSTISLIIAISLFDKFGINKKLTEKRTELVLELIAELKAQEGFGTNIFESGNFITNPPFYFGINMLEKASKMFKHMQNERNQSYLDAPININSQDFDEAFKKVRKLLNNPIMPKSIVQKSSFLKLSGGHNNKELRARKIIVFVYFTSKAKKELIANNGNTWVVSSNNDCTLREFLVKFENIFKECQQWTDNHSDISEELNFQNFDLN